MLLLDIISNVDFMHWFQFIESRINIQEMNRTVRFRYSSLVLHTLSRFFLLYKQTGTRLSMLDPRLDA